MADQAAEDPTRLDKAVRAALLLDAYGPLLTERQFRALDMFYQQDCSLAEIAQAGGSSRQAAHDLIRRGEAQLEEYEKLLGLGAAGERRGESARKIASVVNNSQMSRREIDRVNRLLAGI